jgi:tRNA_anti-like
MKKWTRIILTIVLVGLITGGYFVYRIFTKPHRDVTTEKAVTVTAQQLFDAFKTDETAANTLYLDKAIQLSGEVLDINTNQEGKTVVNFKTNDPLFVINCTFKTNPGALKAGDSIIFKGICTGYIPDANVVINEGVLVKN